jgi:hypothetical protein
MSFYIVEGKIIIFHLTFVTWTVIYVEHFEYVFISARGLNYL